MNHKIILRVLFCTFFPLVLLLFSYNITVGLWQWTPSQEKVIDYLYHDQNFEGATALELSHLDDVKEVMKKMDILFFVSVIFFIWMAWHNYKDKKELQWLGIYGGMTTVLLVILFIFAVVFKFQWLFAGFHQILFPQGNWLFPYDSFLINHFSFDFFEMISAIIFGQTLFWGSIFIGIALYYYYGSIKNH